MRRIVLHRVTLGIVGLALISSLALYAKDFWIEKPHTKWSKKEAEKVLNDSPWADTFTFTDQTQSVYTPNTRGSAVSDPRENMEVYRHFRVRFLSAKPIRMAFSRMSLILERGDRVEGSDPRGQEFIDRVYKDHVVVAVDAESSSTRYRGEMMQILVNLNLGLLQNNTYLQRKSGEKNYITEFVPPGKDGIGARFSFPRTVNGVPFIKEDSGVVRFVTELSSQYRMNIPFKVGKMMFEGKLEY